MKDVAVMIFTFALVLGAMVIIHEFGHFIVAKLFGVRVEVFSVGMGKRLWGFKRGDTDYRISLMPLGGYVKMAGENPEDSVANAAIEFSNPYKNVKSADDSTPEKTGPAPYEFLAKPKWQRFCIAVAGPAMNILTAFAIPMGHSMIHHTAYAYQTEPAVIKFVEEGLPAASAGMQPGDMIVSLDGRSTPTWRDVEEQIIINPGRTVSVTVQREGQSKTMPLTIAVRTIENEKIGEAGVEPGLGANVRLLVREVNPGSPAAEAGLAQDDQIVGVNGKEVRQGLFGQKEVIQTIQASADKPVTLTVLREGKKIDVTAVPRPDSGVPKLGFNQSLDGIERIVSRLGPVDALNYSIDLNVRMVRMTGKAIGQWIGGERSARDTVSGPVGILRLTGQAAQDGVGSVLQLTAMISLNLGVVNLLPIPVLDGGLIFMLLLESFLGIFGLPLPGLIKERMMQVGFVFLMLLMAFVIFNDLSKWIPSKSEPQKLEQKYQAPKE